MSPSVDAAGPDDVTVEQRSHGECRCPLVRRRWEGVHRSVVESEDGGRAVWETTGDVSKSERAFLVSSATALPTPLCGSRVVRPQHAADQRAAGAAVDCGWVQSVQPIFFPGRDGLGAGKLVW